MAATGTPQVNCHNKLTQKLPQKQLKGIASYLNTICLKSSQSSTSQNEWTFFQDNFNGLTFLVDIEVVTKREEDGTKVFVCKSVGELFLFVQPNMQMLTGKKIKS